MALFTGIGDFFRGAFGEDDEEKKRRKQREAQEAAQRRAAQQPKPQPVQPPQQKPRNVSDLFGKKPTADPLNIASKPVTPKPKQATAPRPAPLPDVEFKDIRTVNRENKKVFGQEVPVLGKIDKVAVDRTVTTNKDKYVAAFDKLDDDRKRILIKEVTKLADEGDKAAINTLVALGEAGRTKINRDRLQRAADFASVPGRSIMRVGTGLGQGASGLYDLASPGTGTNRVSQFLDKAAKTQDESAKEAGVEAAYKTGNVVGELVSFAIPSTLAFKIAGKFPKGTKLTDDIVDKVAKFVEESGEGSRIPNIRKFLADRMRNNMTLDEAIQEALITNRYIGQNASRGEDTSPGSVATDLATGVFGSLMFPGRRIRRALEEDELIQEGTAGAVSATTQAAEDQIARSVDDVVEKVEEKGVRNATQEELEAVVNDVDRPAIDRKPAADELKRRADEAATAAKTPVDETPSYQNKQDIENIVREVEDSLNDYLVANPNLTPAQIEAAQKAAQERALKLIEDLKAGRRAATEAVEGQGEELAANASKQADVNAEVAAARAASTSPEGNQIVEGKPVSADPEVAANNVYDYDQAIDRLDELTERIGDKTQASDNPMSRFFGAMRNIPVVGMDSWRRGVDKVRDTANDFLYDKTIGSTNALNAKPMAAVRTLFDKAGMKDTDRLKVNSYSAAKEANASRVQAHARDIEDMFKQVEDPAETAKRLYQVFEEPDMLARQYGEGTPNLSLDDLTPQERAIAERLIELNKVRNEVWYRILQERHAARLISDEDLMKARQSYLENQDGMHSPRIYDLDLKDMGIEVKGGVNTNVGAYKSRKNVDELSQDVIDSINANPAQSMLFRLQSGLDELGRIDAIKQLEDAGYVRDTPPNKNWVKLDGQQYGAANGKYLDKQIVGELEQVKLFNSEAGQKASDLLDVYRNSVFGMADRAVKRAKTSYSPGTFIGNLVSNPAFFNRGAGVNAVQQTYNMAKNVPNLIEHTRGTKLDADILEMQRHGIKIGNTADELVGSKTDYKVIGDDGLLTSVKDVALLPNKIYAGTDDLAKVAIYKTLRKRGMDAETAARRVSQFTQDYGNAGRAVQMLADSPVLGQPFARFVPELLRITKNNIMYNPVGTFAGLYGLAALQQELNKYTGETSEDRALRENAPGKVKIPFTEWVNKMVGAEGDISLDFPVEDKYTVNAARALGFNFPLEPGSDARTSLLRNLAPFVIPFTEDPNGDQQFQPQQIVSSMFLRPLAEQWANKDFMGRTVDDPLNRVRDEMDSGNETKYTDNLSDEAKLNNRLYHLAMNWFPMSGEADAIATKTGVRDELTQPGLNDKGKDYYGKDRTGAEAIWRALGLKVDKNDEKARETRRDINDYYEKEKPIVDNFLSENPELAESYWNIRSTTRDRYTDVSANDIISPEKYKIIAADQSGKLFEFFKQQAMKESKEKGTQLDPIYTLPPDQANSVIKLKSMYTGDDVKFQQLLYKEPWFAGYKDADKKYQTSKPEFTPYPGQAKTNPRPEEWYNLSEELYADEGVKSKFPLVKQYQDKIDTFANYDSDERKEFTKAWYDTYGDAYKQQKANYEAARLDIVNKMREIEGAPPMSAEVWSGQFETDEDRAGYGFGGGGTRNPSSQLGELTNFTGSIDRLNPIEAAAMPQLAQLFARLRAGEGGTRAKPRLGASSSGR